MVQIFPELRKWFHHQDHMLNGNHNSYTTDEFLCLFIWTKPAKKGATDVFFGIFFNASSAGAPRTCGVRASIPLTRAVYRFGT
ncbi:hypothetical protein PIB30_038421, partial [Stylosanthes scabra]|nr:hypothetical protein [Stylosanthes scabra]